jgi:predicted kinase
MKKKLYVLVGAPGSGKSTWAQTHLASLPTPALYVSRDVIRYSLVNEDEEYFSKEKEVYKQFISTIRHGLQKCNSVIADATHLNENSRSKLLRALGTSLRDVEVSAVVIQQSLEDTLSQNKMRYGTRAFVPEEQVKKMYSSMTIPTFEEGFDKIYIYNSNKCTILEKG